MKKNSKINSYIICGLIILGFSASFSVAAMLFLVSDLSLVLKIIASILVWGLSPLIAWVKGSSTGEKDYKSAKLLLPQEEKSEFKAVKTNNVASLYYLISYVAPLLIILFIGILAKKGVFGLISYMFLITLMWVNSIDAETVNSIASFFIYFIQIFINCAAFIIAYIIKIEKAKRIHREIASELRSFKN